MSAPLVLISFEFKQNCSWALVQTVLSWNTKLTLEQDAPSRGLAFFCLRLPKCASCPGSLTEVTPEDSFSEGEINCWPGCSAAVWPKCWCHQMFCSGFARNPIQQTGWVSLFPHVVGQGYIFGSSCVKKGTLFLKTGNLGKISMQSLTV